jgi:hypothetical protein
MHRAEVNGRVVRDADDQTAEVWPNRQSASRHVDQIIRDFQRRRHVQILRDVAWVRVSWYAERAVAHEFRLIECSSEGCVRDESLAVIGGQRRPF